VKRHFAGHHRLLHARERPGEQRERHDPHQRHELRLVVIGGDLGAAKYKSA
jgi:hypothetical protein